MNSPASSISPNQALLIAEHVDKVCDQFEAAWPAKGSDGPQPRIEDFLGDTAEPERSQLLAGLLALELGYRRDGGETPTREEYWPRFPEHGEIIGRAFGQLNLLPSPVARPAPVDDSRTQAIGQRAVRSDSEATAAPTLFPAAAGADGRQPPTGAVSTLARFRLLRLHATGGLGEVHVAVDTELRREVAFKRIQDRYADDPVSCQRLLREAEITGNLEHPGIVPVYGLGQDADGRPFYAMRLIPGDSLKQAIQRFHAADTADRDPGERTLAMRELLGRFVAVCNAVAYAHSRGVVHRDLKPANVMLGPYGETLVVDWGLAKPFRLSEDRKNAEGDTLRPAFAGGLEPTQVGRALGTPSYMPPEQAAGQSDEFGPASDVYSLGATLYCLLTGQAPFANDECDRTLKLVERGDFLRPGQVKANVPPALAAICLKAMALRPVDRYATARALANDIEHWLADEPVSCWHEPWRVRAHRWKRRHPAMVGAITAAIALLVVVGGIAAWWLGGEEAERRAEQARTRQAIETALRDADKLQRQAHWDDADAVLVEALSRLGPEGANDLRQRVEQARANPRVAKRLEEIRLQRATIVEGKFNNAGVASDYAAAFRKYGLDMVGDPAALARRVGASPVREQLVAALDDWAWAAAFHQRDVKTCKRLLAVARAADPDRWRDRLRDPAVWRDPKALAQLAAQKEVMQCSPVLLANLGGRLEKLGGDGVGLLVRAQRRHPGDFWLNFNLANVLNKPRPGRWEEAVGYYRAALAVRPNTPVVYNNLGNALQAKGNLEEAIAEYKKALAIDPKFAVPHYNLGNALRRKGDRDGAITEYKKAIALNPKYAYAHNNLGVALADKGDLAGAIAEYKKTIAIDPKHAYAHNNLGFALFRKRNLDEAIAEYKKALAIDPKFAGAYLNLGNALRRKGDLEGAIGAFQKAIDTDPKDAAAHNNLGVALKAKGDLEGAIAEYKKAIALNPKYAHLHNNLGVALKAKGDLDGAIAEYKKAIEIDPKYVTARNNLRRALAAKRQRGK
jgi:tetratricopeptide (TPR) repeat protein/tRNA A-37 threonylcarbamoyl transferase component Bud32